MFFSRSDRWITLTLWDDQNAIDALDHDTDYAHTVEGILALGVLGEGQETEIFAFEGGSFGEMRYRLRCSRAHRTGRNRQVAPVDLAKTPDLH